MEITTSITSVEIQKPKKRIWLFLDLVSDYIHGWWETILILSNKKKRQVMNRSIKELERGEGESLESIKKEFNIK